MINLDKMEISKPEIAAALRELENKNGQLTPEAVLQAARSSNSPLHNCGFEWNKEAAAHKYNVEVARSLICTVRYRIETSDHGVIKAPVYVRDPHAEHASQGYVALREIVQRGPDAHVIVANEVEQALSHLGRALSVGIALGFNDEIGKLIASAEKFKLRVEREAETSQGRVARYLFGEVRLGVWSDQMRSGAVS